MPTTISTASQQWASRPNDERFTSLTDLHSHLTRQRQNSRATVKANRRLEFSPVQGDDTFRSLQAIVHGVKTPTGEPVILDPTHWSFGQVATLANAPAGYLRTLPAPLAADALNWGLHKAREIEEVGLLLRKEVGFTEPSSVNPNPPGPIMSYTLAAATGPRYGRVWNDDISRSLVENFGDGVSGDWRVPGEFGVALDRVTKANTTIYASDRDMFVFLADEKNRIEVPNTRSDSLLSSRSPRTLARGFYVWNSEVGAQTFGIASFLFDYACKNRTIWGAEGFKELRIRHTASAPDRWIEQVQPMLVDYSQSSAGSLVETVKAAQQRKVDDVREFLANRKFSKSVISGAMASHETDEGRPMESLWDVSNGLTGYARDIPYQDERVAIERSAGALLDLVAA